MEQDFLKCGLAGWCMEVFWTGCISILKKDKKMTCNTSLLMFPIYGMASVIRPASRILKNRHFMFRGTVYAFGIFIMEYVTGSFLKRKGMCPWDYSDSRYNVNGLIRLDYAPAWFGAGLLFEKVLGINEKG